MFAIQYRILHNVNSVNEFCKLSSCDLLLTVYCVTSCTLSLSLSFARKGRLFIVRARCCVRISVSVCHHIGVHINSSVANLIYVA